MSIIGDIAGKFEAAKDKAAKVAQGAGQSAADLARTTYIQNLPAHGWLWQYIPPEQSADGTRIEGKVRPTREGLKWGAVAAVVVVGASMLSRGR